MHIPPSLLGNGSVNTFPRQRILATIEELLDASFSIRSVSYQRRVRGSICVSLSLLGNGSVSTIPRQRRIVGGVCFYAVRVVSKESRRLVLPRTVTSSFWMTNRKRCWLGQFQDIISEFLWIDWGKLRKQLADPRLGFEQGTSRVLVKTHTAVMTCSANVSVSSIGLSFNVWFSVFWIINSVSENSGKLRPSQLIGCGV
jgi:hypothetical protein